MDKGRLNQFVRLLKKTFTMKSPSFDLGLIIKEPTSKIDSRNVFEELEKEVNIEKVVYDKSVIDEDVIEKIIEVFKKNKWLFLEIEKDISSPLLNQLKHLTNHNMLQLIDYRGKDLVEIKMPKHSRIIVFAERNVIEKKINYPHFYRLFGPVLSIK